MPDPSTSRRGHTPAQSAWPKAYLLEIYAQAVQHGHVLLHPITEERASSLTKALYAIRRRSRPGESAATFILPEYHLVTVGLWRRDNSGTLPIYYTTSDQPLPTITPVPNSAVALPQPAAHQPLPTTPSADDMDLTPSDIDDYVAGLLAESQGKSQS